MKRRITFTLLLLVTVVGTGCSRFKGLTRRDYALSKDPFATDENSNVDEPPVPGMKASTAGFVSLESTPDAPELSAATTADYGDQTDADQKKRSKFPGLRVQGMGDVISSEVGPSLADFQDKQPIPIGQSLTPQENDGMASMAEFIKEQATASGMEETANAANEDFTAYAAAKNAEWQEEVEKVNESASPLIQQISQETMTDLEEVAKTANAMITAEQNKAVPLIRKPITAFEATEQPKQMHGAATNSAPIGSPNPFATPDVQPRAKRQPVTETQPDKSVFETPTAESQPVSNPFAEFDKPAAEVRSSTNTPSTSSPKTPDSGFSFDNGWRSSSAFDE